MAGTKKISQLDNLTDGLLTGEAILPVVIADPLTPNRKSKVNQLFRGVSAGTLAAPGLAFDLNRATGLYQNAYDEIGIAFGGSAFYFETITESTTLVTNRISAVGEEDNINITFQPKGSGVVSLSSGSLFKVQDVQFEIADDVSSAKRARFDCSLLGTGLKTFALPPITVGNSSTLVGTDTAQTLSNKTILVDEDNLSITDGTKIAKFGIDWILTEDGTKQYFFPDPGPGVINSNIIDDVSEQTLSSKTLVQPSFAASSTTTDKVLFDASNITASRTLTMPDLSVIMVGTDATQTLSNKIYENPIFAPDTDATKKIAFELSNLFPNSTTNISFPTTLNTSGTSLLVTELATQTLRNKSLDRPDIIDINDADRRVRFDLTNITGTRTIVFPNEDATLLASSNTSTIEGISFAGAISADFFGGRLRLRTHFLAGW
ncbi:hypothetical protein [Synechococcus phage S-H38]|uniref:Uncharacterized protein n=1 Tax=Synechococcus phage S-H38 TaxID=2783673 RepID=A0A873WA19_9CAUD|nr:hypothetical protein PQC14_gp152 [Synechococcus phage S-H38]QPB07909.1 hypothetical protein [Synechococcus phage S-H38]